MSRMCCSTFAGTATGRPQLHAASSRRGERLAGPLSDEPALELGKDRGDRLHRLALRRARAPFGSHTALYSQYENPIDSVRRKGQQWAAMNKPGQIVDRSGIYGTVGGREAALSKGDRFPPTKAGSAWKPVRLTKPTPKVGGAKKK
jgi:hypothetical protein